MNNIIKNHKNLIYTAVGIVILVAVFYGVSKLSKEKEDNIEEYSVSQIQKLDEKQRKEALEEKLRQYQETVNNLPQDANSSDKYSAYIVLSEAQIALEKYDDALKSLEAIPDDKRNSKRAYYQFAQIYKAKDDKFKAMENATKAIERDQGDVPSWLLYLEVATSLTNTELNAKYREAVVKTGSNVEIMISYAKFCERIGDKATAVAAWETAINGDPANEGKYREEIARLR